MQQKNKTRNSTQGLGMRVLTLEEMLLVGAGGKSGRSGKGKNSGKGAGKGKDSGNGKNSGKISCPGKGKSDEVLLP